ncbi:MAG TPA: peptidoglycan-binding protein LysM [Casimicrobium sp.]|jgi:nucleoid-associated protein YgaU|nr:peptidoglycan-binding protein LysM [Burkholderiales bacterium]HNY46277.1 peptidoglycan-binding protein LysM [Casimicrobium sp.]HPG62168.1 peptidoglycan-binding protein LysM [Casimicrobium sp.]HPT57573.1 peptidoglycan-binding protein LysM [Casimicrobium sp.]HPV23475.1 peptidoglycan-binding protein LysM [Casimicrobium sp.]
MGLFSFIKDAGEKLFGHKDAEAVAAAAAADDEAAKAKLEATNRAAGDAIQTYIEAQGLTITGLVVTYDAASSSVSLFGVAEDQATKEKALLCAGNVAGVDNVNDNMSVDLSEPEAQYHDVVSGDNLSKIAKAYYGDPNKYPVIFEANKPMLSHPDKIYPGQKLRIPPL